ncbi:hypothetical protein K1T71_005870 [Dendrolimus kikuchii]|uniref:Uncharacterized protein n=1 Tax=Dendrolimus kikuchii TaxID=765133 RepID=A0ACC1D3D3_9NEOP|nr:hypothetical protein K1T71_005870 [Dendrolimus kikuchii]
MAKFHNYYVLCPLIDQKSFLGITRDKEEECVIVTLGRNVVNKYRLSDQKQIGGWTSKDHITSAVIYNKAQDEYVGIFNNNTLKIWKEDVTNLDKVKKNKFPMNINKLVIRGQQSPLLIFANGNCAALTYAVDNRKSFESKSILKETDVIIDHLWHLIEETKQEYICYIIKNSKEEFEILHCMLREEFSDLDKSKMNRIKVSREGVYVVGQLANKDKLAVYILWSDGKLTFYDLIKKSWQPVGNVHWISTVNKVSMAFMGRNHIILFGSNIEQDGAIIVAYNITLGVASSRYPMKMYTENARLYCWLHKIMLEASNHIGVLPYSLETNRNLSTLLGSHEIQDNTMEIVDWDTPKETIFRVPSTLSDCVKIGLTERSICAQTIANILETNDCDKIFEILAEFNDIPESVLVILVKFCIKTIVLDEMDIVNLNGLAKFCHENYTEMKDKFDLFNYVLQISFSDALITPYLRNSLTVDDTLFLLTYITYLLTFSDTTLTVCCETKLHDWCTLLIDAFHQHYLMTKDEKVTIVLNNVNNAVVNSIKVLNKVSYVMAPLNKLLSGKSIADNDDSLSYSVELMVI